ncbi:MAG: type II toxin-antitoxin system RelE/ParE family toxin [bacterium]
MGDNYKIVLRPAARRDFDALDRQTFRRIISKINVLKSDARPPGSKKLVGRDNEHRLRIGSYRVLYEIDDKEKIIRIFRVLHRREAYR